MDKELLHNNLANLKGDYYDSSMFLKLKSYGLKQVEVAIWGSEKYDTKYKFVQASCITGSNDRNKVNYVKRVVCIEADGSVNLLIATNSPNIIYADKIEQEKNRVKVVERKITKKKFPQFENPYVFEYNTISSALSALNNKMSKTEEGRQIAKCFKYGKISPNDIPLAFPKGSVERGTNVFCKWVTLTKASEKKYIGEIFISATEKKYVKVPIKFSMKDILAAIASNCQYKEMVEDLLKG